MNQSEDIADRVDSIAGKLWKLGWPLVFVVAMTMLSECGPHTTYTKAPPADEVPVASLHLSHAVK